MNKQLATYLFSNEVLFKESNNTLEEQLIKEEQTVVLENKEEPTIAATTEVVNTEKEVTMAILEQKQVLELKSLVIIVNNITKEQMGFLVKILGSVKMQLENVTLIDIIKDPNFNLKAESYKSNSSIQKIISFGVAMSNFQIDILLFPYQKLNTQSIDFLIVDDLPTIEVNLKDEKRLLWAALKSMF